MKSDLKMSYHVEVEQSYLLDILPDECENWDRKDVYDKYFPDDAVHPQIRLRQSGNEFFLTKKYPKHVGDFSEMIEETIELEKSEFEFIDKSISGRELRKRRYWKDMANVRVEIDVYLDKLAGLVVLDVEFPSPELRYSFKLPDSFRARKEITDSRPLAAGNLAGKEFADIEAHL